MRRKKSHVRAEQQQQRKFVQHWSPYDEKKQYDALEDPHANYYFYNKSVNQHLKSLKKAVNQQKNVTKKQKMKELIKTKLVAIKLPNIKAQPKASIYADEINRSISQMPSQFRKKSDLSMKSNMGRDNKNETSFSVVQMSRYRKSVKQLTANNINNSVNQVKPKEVQSKEESASNKKLQNSNDVQKSHRESHAKFMDYLIQKKKKLSTAANLSSKTEQNEVKQS